MTIPLVRVPLTLVSAFAFHISMSPPKDPASSASISGSDAKGSGSDRHTKIRATARFIAVLATKGLYWASALTDTVLLLAPYFPTSLPKTPLIPWLRALTPTLSLNIPIPTSISLPFLPSLPFLTIAGTSLALMGAFLRHKAYHSLGQFYTCPNPGSGCYTSSRGNRIRHAHALITTGPYAFVRHPGYAGLVLSTTGLVVLHLEVLKGYLGSGSSAGVDRVSGWMRTVALVCALLVTVGGLGRIRGEERALRAQFKGEWEAWAKRVRYRLVPGLY